MSPRNSVEQVFLEGDTGGEYKLHGGGGYKLHWREGVQKLRVTLRGVLSFILFF